jgi:hypothetical protein
MAPGSFRTSPHVEKESGEECRWGFYQGGSSCDQQRRANRRQMQGRENPCLRFVLEASFFPNSGVPQTAPWAQ